MYSSRQRRQPAAKPAVKQTVKSTPTKTVSSSKSSSKPVSTPVNAKVKSSKPVVGKVVPSKMVEEEEESLTSSEYEEDDRMEEVSKEEEVVDKKAERQKMREQIADETVDAVRLDKDLIIAISERYQELLQELYATDDRIESLNLSEDAKEMINEKANLWLEYFLASSTFRDPKANIFDKMDSFIKTNKFV